MVVDSPQGAPDHRRFYFIYFRKITCIYNYNLRKQRNELVRKRAEMESESASRVDQSVPSYGMNERAVYGLKNDDKAYGSDVVG